MAQFTNFFPTFGQTDIPKTTTVSYTILTDGYDGAQIGTLSTIIDGYQVIENGAFVNGYSGNIFSSTGKYVVGVYPKSPDFLGGAKAISVELEVLDSYGSLDAYSYTFYTAGYGVAEEVVESPPLTNRACQYKPFFPSTDLGLVAALDSGIGTEVELTWKQAHPYDEDNVVYYNIRFNTDRSLVLNSDPIFIVSDVEATIAGLCPGDTNYFNLKAVEFDPTLLTTDGMTQGGTNMFFYPESVVDLEVAIDDLLIPGSTDGFPDYGILDIGTELIRYVSKSVIPEGFVISSNGRGYGEDGNTIVVQATPTFTKPNDQVTWVKIDGYGNDGYRDGYDGYDKVYSGGPNAYRLFDGYDGYYRYRQEEFDNITTDGTNNDSLGDFKRFDYCGTYRRLSPASFMQGQCSGSYWGGVQLKNGNRVRVPDLTTHILQREELLLETTGEPFILLRRMWTGIRCACMMSRREHSDARCSICYGTGFVQGYTQFFNPRRPDRRILVSIDPATDDVQIVDRGGLEPVYEPDGWTLPFPSIKDRDVVIRFNENGTVEYRYEVLNVTRVRNVFSTSGAQKIKFKRFPVTDIIYQFPIVGDTSPAPEGLTTSTNIAPGLPAHSHDIIIPNGADINTIRIATLLSEGHNHTIINGVVMPVLGHTHTI